MRSACRCRRRGTADLAGRVTWGWTFLPQHTAASIIILPLGALLGDMGKSFVKRRLGKKRGESWPIADQYDLVAGAFILMLVFDPSWLFTYGHMADPYRYPDPDTDPPPCGQHYRIHMRGQEGTLVNTYEKDR